MNARSHGQRMAISARTAAAAASLILIALFFSGCAGYQSFKLESQPLTAPVTIDGKPDEWRGHLYYNVQGQYSLGFSNDDHNLYVCLVVTDPYKRSQILRGGLTLWVDPKGGEARTFGLRFPMGWRAGATRTPRPDGRSELPPEDDDEQPIGSDAWNEFALVTPKNELPIVMKTEEGQGLEMKASAPAGMFVYELRIPLRKSDKEPWAVGSEPGRTISLGFESGKPSYGRYMGPRGMGGGMGGRYGRPEVGDTYMGGMGPRGVQIPEDLKVWATVKLR